MEPMESGGGGGKAGKVFAKIVGRGKFAI